MFQAIEMTTESMNRGKMPIINKDISDIDVYAQKNNHLIDKERSEVVSEVIADVIL